MSEEKKESEVEAKTTEETKSEEPSAEEIKKAEEAKTAAMCMCKQSKNPPYCDGSHMSL